MSNPPLNFLNISFFLFASDVKPMFLPLAWVNVFMINPDFRILRLKVSIRKLNNSLFNSHLFSFIIRQSFVHLNQQGKCPGGLGPLFPVAC